MPHVRSEAADARRRQQQQQCWLPAARRSQHRQQYQQQPPLQQQPQPWQQQQGQRKSALISRQQKLRQADKEAATAARHEQVLGRLDRIVELLELMLPQQQKLQQQQQQQRQYQQLTTLGGGFAFGADAPEFCGRGAALQPDAASELLAALTEPGLNPKAPVFVPGHVAMGPGVWMPMPTPAPPTSQPLDPAGFGKAGDVSAIAVADNNAEKAVEVFREMQHLGLESTMITHNALISACDKGNKADLALDVFAEMQHKGLKPDANTYSAVISACVKCTASAAAAAAAASSAEDARQRGNDLLQSGRLDEAVAAYTEGVECAGDVDGLRIPLLSNRSLALLKLGRCCEALADAEAVLEAEPSHSKAGFRRSKALLGLHHWGDAAQALGWLARAEPGNAEIRVELARAKACRRVTSRQHAPAGMTCGQHAAVAVRAFENDIGVQAPVGFWDPAGFTADGNSVNFARRLRTDLKHGRVSMLATMGYITPGITGKLPGYLSPSAGFNFADIPNGLAAISKVPAAAAILAYGAFWDLAHDQSAGTRAAAGDDGFKILSSSDPAEMTKKLSAELANGGLAMMAIIGMCFQDGLTGSAWGDWAFYTASPLRAFDNELGVHAPVGSRDLAGFTADGNFDDFARRRQTEAAGRLPTTASTAAVIAAAAGQAATSACQAAGMRTAETPTFAAAASGQVYNAAGIDKFTPRRFTTRQARHHGLIPDDNRGSS